MTERCIMIFPEFSNIHIINRLRSLHDPLANLVRPHITLVFPFASDFTTLEMTQHIQGVMNDVKVFNIRLKGIRPSLDGGNYLFLNVSDGFEEIRNIHDRLYSSIFKQFHKLDIPYVPHMTVGRINNNNLFQEAINATKDIDSIFETQVNRISVEIIGNMEESIIEFEHILRS